MSCKNSMEFVSAVRSTGLQAEIVLVALRVHLSNEGPFDEKFFDVILEEAIGGERDVPDAIRSAYDHLEKELHSLTGH